MADKLTRLNLSVTGGIFALSETPVWLRVTLGVSPLSRHRPGYWLLVAHQVSGSRICLRGVHRRCRYGAGANRSDLHFIMGHVD
jgi:hypothetical protein